MSDLLDVPMKSPHRSFVPQVSKWNQHVFPLLSPSINQRPLSLSLQSPTYSAFLSNSLTRRHAPQFLPPRNISRLCLNSYFVIQTESLLLHICLWNSVLSYHAKPVHLSKSGVLVFVLVVICITNYSDSFC